MSETAPQGTPGAGRAHAGRQRAMARLIGLAALAPLAAILVSASGAQHSSLRVPHVAPTSADSPPCTPRQLDATDRIAPGLQVSPQPGTYAASPGTQISFLGRPPSQLGDIQVAGSVSGSHSGSLRAYSQGDGGSYVPDKPFSPGETVFVQLRLRGRTLRFRFTVAREDIIVRNPFGAQPAGTPTQVQRFVSRPDLSPPAISVDISTPSQAGGYVFAAPYSGPGQDGPMIFDSHGQLVWFKPMPAGVEATDLQVQRYQGRPVLTWWQGFVSDHGFGQGHGVIADRSYRQIAQVNVGNGYGGVDLHDYQLQANGSARVTVFNPVRCDLSAVGGGRTSAVTDGIMQEIDVRTGLVRREWHALDHVAQRSSYQPASTASVAWPWDFFHINSIAAGPGGDLLISARSTWTVYDVNSATGQVRWTLGGKESTYARDSATAIAWQHDARLVAADQLSVFDNGSSPQVHSQTRGLLVSLNPATRSATVAREFVHPSTPLVADSQGNIQLLDGGHVFMGWGSQPYFTEYDSVGNPVFDAHMPPADQSYRAFRFPWQAAPSGPPAIAVSAAGGSTSVHASWNGATQVASWRVLAGAAPGALRPLTQAPRQGFETALTVPGAPRYLAVQALGAQGEVLGTSHTVGR